MNLSRKAKLLCLFLSVDIIYSNLPGGCILDNLIPLSSGDPRIDDNLRKINKFWLEKHKKEQELRNKKTELKKITFFFAQLGVLLIPALLGCTVYGLWTASTITQKIIFISGMACIVAIAAWLSRMVYKFVFYHLK